MIPVFEQCEENTNLQDPTRYLKLPFSKGLLLGTSNLATKTKESFWITSFLCSTKLTQNGSVPASRGEGLCKGWGLAGIVRHRLAIQMLEESDPCRGVGGTILSQDLYSACHGRASS